jgi:hypothetical protein
MATSVSLGYCPWFAGPTWSDTIGRLDVAAETIQGGTRGGVLMSASNPLAVLAASGMNITINVGTAIVPSTIGPTNGAYRPTNPALQTLTVSAAPVTPNTRVDLVVVQITDNGNNTSFGEIIIVPGIAANPGVAPTQPANSILLATIAVGSGVSVLSQANITDNRFYCSAAGGVTYFSSTSAAPIPGSAGWVGYDAVNARFFHWNAAGYAQFATGPWPPSGIAGNGNATLVGNTGFGGTLTTLTFGTSSMATNISTDGSTDIEVSIICSGISMVTPTLTQLIHAIYIDSTQLAEWDTIVGETTATFTGDGFQFAYRTSSWTSDTPTAGSHTVSWRSVARQQSVAQTVTLQDAPTKHSYITIKPVLL